MLETLNCYNTGEEGEHKICFCFIFKTSLIMNSLQRPKIYLTLITKNLSFTVFIFEETTFHSFCLQCAAFSWTKCVRNNVVTRQIELNRICSMPIHFWLSFWKHLCPLRMKNISAKAYGCGYYLLILSNLAGNCKHRWVYLVISQSNSTNRSDFWKSNKLTKQLPCWTSRNLDSTQYGKSPVHLESSPYK